ncbi:MAG TPA: DUF1549 and DUF1553 domain-containing protein [Gemmataceae bacterium]|nr:DUF1549 and DUF1553 domain-containing protein [Gemmataceae bacterium]
MALPRFRALFICLAFLSFATGVDARPPSFRNEVMAVLSRAGCNQGVCHGNQNGKNGFKLSLRGQDPDADFQALSRDMLGRRTNVERPDDSLILLKPTARVPHEGGRRFRVNSPEYAILRNWIAAGMPKDRPDTPRLEQLTVMPAEQVLLAPLERVRLHAQAKFSDGHNRDVSALVVYESSNPAVVVTAAGEAHCHPDTDTGVVESAILVRYLDHQAVVRLAFVPEQPTYHDRTIPANNFIDRHVFARLHRLRIEPSPLCSDTVFLRRAFLDTLGILPTAAETRAFLSDHRPDKRARLIDHLLDRPEFADFWALKWSDLLRNEEKVLDPKGVEAFHHWIRNSIADGQPLNEFARAVISARGSSYRHPAANFYRAVRDPQSRAEAVAQVFLGIRLQCARCHNHPFDHWTQDDYYGLAAFFARVHYKIIRNRQRDRLDTHEFDGEQIVWQARTGELRQPRTGVIVAPRFLGEPGRSLPPHADRLQALADWIARPDNPFFARTQVNRIWYHLLGRGLVDPDDDFRASNPPMDTQLLDALTQDFVAHHFDLRHAVRVIMNSRTYQLSSVPNASNRTDETHFSHALVRPLQAEQLLDALAQVLAVPVQFHGWPAGTRAGQLPGVASFRTRRRRPLDSERFLQVFGKPDRLLTCECERSSDTTLGQAFQLITGTLENGLLSAPHNRLGQLLAVGRTDRQILAEFYLTALSRQPRESELRTAEAVIQRAKQRRAGLEDVVWALLNAKEFLLRH